MLRGNHECRQMTISFTFRQEILLKYDQEVFNAFCGLFDFLPLSCVVNGKFLALHAGISPELKTLSDLNRIDRFHEIPKNGLFCDILWADPIESEDGCVPGKFQFNHNRNCSYIFGIEATAKFLSHNNLMSIIRAHEVQYEGYRMYNWKSSSYRDRDRNFPQVITIFSAPKYSDSYNNKGAIIKFEV